jgi:hypothetical protein
MSWNRDSLWAKACIFMERAFQESKEDPLFGLWAALALELLARSAVSNVNPTLLAKPDSEHKYLLHALGRGSERIPRLSLGSAEVLNLCQTLVDKFTEDDKKLCNALINRRNEELHSGSSAFEEYPSAQWLSGFYRACKILCESQNKTLEDLIGTEEAKIALQTLIGKRTEIEAVVKSKIAAHKKVFESKPEEDRTSAILNAEKTASELSWKGAHKTKCPACGCSASFTGIAYGKEQVTHADGEIVVRQPVSPRTFSCSACSLTLASYAELDVCGLGGRYSKRSHYSPEDYYGMVVPEDDVPDVEYNNE